MFMPDWPKTRSRVAQLPTPEISPAFGFQTGVLYYHANWIGNLAIGITAVSYLSTFFPILNNPVPAGIACIAIVWIFTFVNMLGGTWVSRLTTIGLVLVLIPVVMTAVVGWHWFDVATYQANWNTSSTTDSHAVIKKYPALPVGWRRIRRREYRDGEKPETYRTAGYHAGYCDGRYRLYRRDSGYRRYVSCFSDGRVRCAVRD
jgi:hypothetical protein